MPIPYRECRIQATLQPGAQLVGSGLQVQFQPVVRGLTAGQYASRLQQQLLALVERARLQIQLQWVIRAQPDLQFRCQPRQ